MIMLSPPTQSDMTSSVIQTSEMVVPGLFIRELKSVHPNLVPIKNYGLLDLPSFRYFETILEVGIFFETVENFSEKVETFIFISCQIVLFDFMVI